jgi:hypothetical protein
MSRVEGKAMEALKLLLVILGIAIFGSASALVVYDVVIAAQLRRILKRPGASYKARTVSERIVPVEGRDFAKSAQALTGQATVPVLPRWRRTATSV